MDQMPSESCWVRENADLLEQALEHLWVADPALRDQINAARRPLLVWQEIERVRRPETRSA